MTDSETPRSDDELDDIGRLLRWMEPPESVAPARQAAARAAAYEVWQDVVRSERRRQRTRRLLAWAAVLVAGMGLALALGLSRGWLGSGSWFDSSHQLGQTPIVAEVLRGSVEVRSGAGVASSLSFGQESVPLGSSVATGSDGRAAFRLAAGESLRLDHDTRVHFVADGVFEFSQGALYVDSDRRSDGGESLEIRTPFGVVRDIGTQFELRILDRGLQVSVREGRVQLSGSGGALEARAGERLEVASDGGTAATEVVLYGEPWAWSLAVAPPYELEGKSLEHYLTTVTREMGWRLEYEDPRLERSAAEIVLHGDLGSLQVQEALVSVLEACGLVPRFANGVLRITEGDPS